MTSINVSQKLGDYEDDLRDIKVQDCDPPTSRFCAGINNKNASFDYFRDSQAPSHFRSVFASPG